MNYNKKIKQKKRNYNRRKTGTTPYLKRYIFNKIRIILTSGKTVNLGLRPFTDHVDTRLVVKRESIQPSSFDYNWGFYKPAPFRPIVEYSKY